ncbi:MAG: 3-deoxy-D-manno-octulosonic acid transferase [Alphaproteobacteria bacterium]|nr:3-deoxy-D-manno-octulosonic acid transferase [Alphaproteobacteria bacterium]
MSFALVGYRILGNLAAPLLRVALARRAARGKEDPARLGERRGLASLARPDGPLVWMHCASVGEAQSTLPLIERLRARGVFVLLTTGTVSSARLMAERLPAGALHQFVPVDKRAWVRRFLAHWRPQLALFVESELWPNLILETQARGVPLALINARLSERSFAGWQRAPKIARRLLQAFSIALAQDETTAERLRSLGASAVTITGTLKLASPPLPADAGALVPLQALIGGRPCWLAASAHPGEEAAISEAHKALSARWPDVLTIVAPRHPARAPLFAASLAGVGARVALRSKGEQPDRAVNAYIADTLGEMGLFYRLAPVAFVGGSLIAHGGQNLLEPARLGACVLHGPDMRNFAELAATLIKAGASEQIDGGAALGAAVARLLADAPERARRVAAAHSALAAEDGALDRIWAGLAPLIDPLAPVVGHVAHAHA